MRSLKLTLAYEGTRFVGWQRQAEGTSIQGLLESILTDIDGAPVAVAGAGRTDAGVHALGQVASCALTGLLDADTLGRALNARLPPDVRVLAVDEMPEAFHARFSATGKRYRYVLANGPLVSPFAARFAWQVPLRLDAALMHQAAAHLVGAHDFSAFQSTGTDVPHAVRTVTLAQIADVTDAPPAPLPAAAVPGGRLLAFEIAADGFLRHMVRALAGTLVEVGLGRRDPNVGPLLASANRALAGPTAPAHGLWLVEVNY
jgi:tRNA pseudouridine38-40 synthase